MFVIKANNVNDALSKGIQFITTHSEPLDSRNGRTLEIPAPVTTVYEEPWKRVLISKVRDANPFFHLMEAMWILAGREDVKFLTEFNKRMGDYSDDGNIFNAPYGYRLRNQFPRYNDNEDLDQLESIIDILRHDPNSRQAVCQIWDTDDLEKPTKDKACNMSTIFRIRKNKLDMTVYNRSNDMIWGTYGANVVQFSMIQEYVAAHLNIDIGKYYQVSNSFHVYLDGPGGKLWDKLNENYEYNHNPYNYIHNVVSMQHVDMKAFEHDLKQFFNVYDKFGIDEICKIEPWISSYFIYLILPVLHTYRKYKQSGVKAALISTKFIVADDWRIACQQWLENRIK